MSDLRDAIERALLDHRLEYVDILDSVGDGLPLVDALSGDSDDIGQGKTEIELLADALADAIEGELSAPARDSAIRELAEEIHRGYDMDMPVSGTPHSVDMVEWTESRLRGLRTLLAEREATQPGPVAWRFRSRLDDDEWSGWSKPIEHDPAAVQGMGPPSFEVQALYAGVPAAGREPPPAVPFAAHVIAKRRRGGGRDGVVHYMVGPRRDTAEEADADLERWLEAPGRERLSLPDQSVTDPTWRDREQQALHWLYGDAESDPRGIGATVLAMLQERSTTEARQAGQLAALRGVAQKIIEDAPPEDWEPDHEHGDWGNSGDSFSEGARAADAAAAKLLRAALASGAGREEAEVIQAAVEVRDLAYTAKYGDPASKWEEDRDKYRRELGRRVDNLEDAVDAMLATRGGKEER